MSLRSDSLKLFKKRKINNRIRIKNARHAVVLELSKRTQVLIKDAGFVMEQDG